MQPGGGGGGGWRWHIPADRVLWVVLLGIGAAGQLRRTTRRLHSYHGRAEARNPPLPLTGLCRRRVNRRRGSPVLLLLVMLPLLFSARGCLRLSRLLLLDANATRVLAHLLILVLALQCLPLKAQLLLLPFALKLLPLEPQLLQCLLLPQALPTRVLAQLFLLLLAPQPLRAHGGSLLLRLILHEAQPT